MQAIIFTASYRCVQAGKNAVDLLRRNALNTGAVWFFPQLILSITAFTLAGALGLLVALGVRLTWPDPGSVLGVSPHHLPVPALTKWFL